jgi:sugar lactone lactonase YvrE
MAEVEHVLAVQNSLGEGPVWHSGEKALYWVDIENFCYFRFDPKTNALEKVDVGVKIGTLAFRASGGYVLATANGFATWDATTRNLHQLGDPEADRPNSRFNDGAVDRRGRFWAGTLGAPPNNALYRLDPDGRIHTMETGLQLSNGIGWNPDGKIMYLTDTNPGIIYAYDFDEETGSITNRRIFAQSSDRNGWPDGLTVDQDGFVWSARWGGSCIERYDPDGKVERTIPIPARSPTSMAFGGDDLRDLYITSARNALKEEERKHPSADGDLFCLRVDVGGFPEPLFAG